MSTTSEPDTEQNPTNTNKPDIEFSNAAIPWNLEVEMRVDPRTGVNANPFVLRTLRDCSGTYFPLNVRH